MAQIISYYLPKSYKGLIQVHNYVETSNTKVKYDNWKLLNQKVLGKFPDHFQLNQNEIKSVVECQQGGIEEVLWKVKKAMERFLNNPPSNLKASQTLKYIDENLANPKNPNQNKDYFE